MPLGTYLGDVSNEEVCRDDVESYVDADAPPTAEEFEKLQGNIIRREPPLIQTMRGELRALHYSMAMAETDCIGGAECACPSPSLRLDLSQREKI